MKQKISTWAESTSKKALGQAGFRPRPSIVDHFVTLRVIMEESRLQGKTNCCFVDFKKAFDIVSQIELWNRMVETHTIEYRVVVARIYKQVKCQPKMDCGFSNPFLSSMGVKAGMSIITHNLWLMC